LYAAILYAAYDEKKKCTYQLPSVQLFICVLSDEIKSSDLFHQNTTTYICWWNKSFYFILRIKAHWGYLILKFISWVTRLHVLTAKWSSSGHSRKGKGSKVHPRTGHEGSEEE